MVNRAEPCLRVLHVSQPTEGGVARCVAQYAAAQVARGWQVGVACPGGQLGTAAAACGAEVLRWSAVRSPTPALAWEVAMLARLVRMWRPDVVHLHSAKAGLAGRIVVRGARPTLFQPHAWSFDAVQGVSRRAALVWERASGRWATTIVCVSDDEHRRGRSHGIRGDYVVAVNGVDLAAFAPADRAWARVELGLPDAPIAVCLGRLSPQKGQDRLIRVWPVVQAALPDALLVLVGDGPSAADLAASAPTGVVMVGSTTSPDRWLAAADVVVVPSRWEGMALVPLEAMASARSVVATAVTGITESLGTLGVGATVAVDDLAALGQAVRTRLADRGLADREGRAGRVQVERHHDLRRTVATIEALTALVASGGRSAGSGPGRR